MKNANACYVEGTAAMALQPNTGLRLVWDASSAEASRRRRAREPRHLSATAFLVAVVAVLLAGILSTVISNARHEAVVGAIESAPLEIVRARSGETLWSLASAHGVEGVSTADIVDWLRQTNDLDSSLLVPGQELVVPLAP